MTGRAVDQSVLNEFKPTSSVLATIYGWPSTGGVWVLKPTQEQFDAFNRNPPTDDMDVHCQMMQQVGATFYRDPSECEEEIEGFASRVSRPVEKPWK